MPFLICGRYSDTGQPSFSFSVAGTKEAARADASARGIIVESVEVINYVSAMQCLLGDLSGLPETAKGAALPFVSANWSSILGSASFLDDEEWDELDEVRFEEPVKEISWEELEVRFEEAVKEISRAWGRADGSGDAGLCWPGAGPPPEVERVTYWKRGNRIAYVLLELCDNTRIRMLSLGEGTQRELLRSS